MNPKISMIGLTHMDSQTPERLTRAFDQLKPDLVTLEYSGEAHDEFFQRMEADGVRDKIKEAISRVYSDLRISNPTDTLEIAFDQYGKEIPCAKKLCQERGIPLVHTDSWEITSKIVEGMYKDDRFLDIADFLRDELTDALDHGIPLDVLTSEQIATHTKNRRDRFVSQFYQLFQRYFKTGKMGPRIQHFIFQGIDTGFLTNERESHQSKTILEAIEKYQAERPIHIGGIFHLSELPWNRKHIAKCLAARLRHQHPLYQRIKDHVKDRYTLSHFDSENTQADPDPQV